MSSRSKLYDCYFDYSTWKVDEVCTGTTLLTNPLSTDVHTRPQEEQKLLILPQVPVHEEQGREERGRLGSGT